MILRFIISWQPPHRDLPSLPAGLPPGDKSRSNFCFFYLLCFLGPVSVLVESHFWRLCFILTKSSNISQPENYIFVHALSEVLRYFYFKSFHSPFFLSLSIKIEIEFRSKSSLKSFTKEEIVRRHLEFIKVIFN